MSVILVALCCAIGGNVHSADGTPIASARIDVAGPTHVVVATDRRGDFSVTLPPGHYRLAASARGFAPAAVALEADADVPVQVALEPVDSPKLRQIGGVTVDGRLTPVVGAVPSLVLSRATFEELGEARVVDGLARVPGVTFSRPDGGSSNAVSVASLRGPDPSESLVALDGQLLNDGNTGDLDLSQIPVAALTAVDVSEGLGPQDRNGSNTFGGAIDLVSLRPTSRPHVALSAARGSFDRTEQWLNATGTHGRLGYAAALDAAHAGGYVNAGVPLYSTSDSSCAPCTTHLGSTVASQLALGTLTWSFNQNADVTARAFILADTRDQSAAINGIDGATNRFIGPGNQTFAQVIRAYQLRGRAPLGAGEISAEASRSDNSIDVAGGNASAYDIVHRDTRDTIEATWQRAFASAEYALGGSVRGETLRFDAPQPTDEAQHISVLFARGGFAPWAKLRLDAGLFQSHYSTFGSNLDGRFGAIYSLLPGTSVRFSIGTGFRAPLLAERYVSPYAALTLDANNVFVGQGNADGQPEHATEYELGASHAFTRRSTLDVSLYRTNLRNPVETFYPLAAVRAGACNDNSYVQPIPACVSSVGNVGSAVYTGAEIRYAVRLAGNRLLLAGQYGLNVAYPRDINAQFANPTSGGNLVNGAQFLGIAQQQGSLEASWEDRGWHAATAAVVRGNNNELHVPPFVTMDAAAGRRVDRYLDVTVAGTNLFNTAAGAYTRFGGGVAYRGIIGVDGGGAPLYGPLPTDAEHVEPLALRLILTYRR